MRIFATLAIAAAMGSTPVFAQECDPRFVENTQTVTVGNVEIGANQVSRTNFGVRVVNEGSGACSAQVRFSRINGTAISTGLSYSLRSESSILEILPDEAATGTSQSDLFIAGIPGGENGRAVPFLLSVPTEWGIEAGFYSEQVQMSLLDETGQVIDTLIVTINVDVPPSASLRIVGATGSEGVARVNLGNITPRDIALSDPFGIRVWSSSSYLVSFASENNGNLRHDNGSDLIPYELRMDERLVNLSGSGEFVFPDKTSSLGRVHRLRVRAGPAVGRAGDYSDRVTVTVTAV
ncbi:hypothetical protein FGU71_05095 [Erythrobacter insulae]|uniref:Spore coat protein U domain-containing protein n=1 Tax=Erythrobacter insulae TaxID=2584124 RepID=A0A547PB81_9SPHN|nr:hypothetical protein [Erythrobacter insulae]TRD11284.1 hypothetical protein FGU71_05095 [Erythrobacter insulae]